MAAKLSSKLTTTRTYQQKMEEDEDDGCSMATSDFIKIGQSADEQGGQEVQSSNEDRHINTTNLGFSGIGIDMGGGNAQQLKWQIEALKVYGIH